MHKVITQKQKRCSSAVPLRRKKAMGMVQYRTLVLHQFPFFSGRIFGSRHNNAQKPWNIDRKNYYQYNMIQDEEAENEQRGMNASLGI